MAQVNGILLDQKTGLALYEVPVIKRRGKKVIHSKRYIAKCSNGCIYTLGKSQRDAKKKFAKMDHKTMSSLNHGRSLISGRVAKTKRSYHTEGKLVLADKPKRKPAKREKSSKSQGIIATLKKEIQALKNHTHKKSTKKTSTNKRRKRK